MKQRILSFLMGFFEKIKPFLTRRNKIIGGISLVVIIMVLTRLGGETVPEQLVEQVPGVQVASVFELNSNKSFIPVVGNVESQAQVTVRAEAQGEIVRIYKKQGVSVYRGDILAEIENGRERAAVDQAKAGVEAAEAGLSILSLQFGNTEKALQEARQATITTLQSAYTTADDAIRNKLDQLFTNPRSFNPSLVFSQNNFELEQFVTRDRVVVEGILNTWNKEIEALSTEGDLSGALETTEENLSRIRSFVENMSILVNSLVANSSTPQTTIDGWKASVYASRVSISGALTSISLQKDILNGKITAYEIAKRQGDTGNTEALQGRAQLSQARAGLRLAETNLAKTFIKAPITGTLNSFSLDVGDFVSAFQPVAVIANNQALEIIASITEEDRKTIAIGNNVRINDRYTGRVTEVAPAVDPQTKKVEVKVGLDSDATAFANGESVSLQIERSILTETEIKEILVPLSALKVFSDRYAVLLVSENILVEQVVEVGPFVGDSIIITSGLTPDMDIVVDARGLRAGETVTITN